VQGHERVHRYTMGYPCRDMNGYCSASSRSVSSVSSNECTVSTPINGHVNIARRIIRYFFVIAHRTLVHREQTVGGELYRPSPTYLSN